MNFVFFGSPEFAKIILEKLINAGYIPAAVVCNPDRPFGRKKIITPPPVKSLIINHKTWNIPILQPEKLDEDFMLRISSFMPDIFIVASYSKIIKKEILDIPKLGTIGVHPSLLPKYRGSSPIQSVILNGETETGVSLYMIDEKVDNGPVLAAQKTQIGNLNYQQLMEVLANISGDLLIKTLPEFLDKKITPKEQDYSQATFTKKFTAQDAFIEPADLKIAINSGGNIAKKIYGKIRALNPEPGTWTIQNDKRMKILQAELDFENKLRLKIIQYEGKLPKII